MPAASSLTRARRSISDERSMPIAWLERGPNSSIIRPGAGADVDQPAERPLAERAVDRALDLALGDVERADLVPDLGMAGEIAVGGLGALGADGLGAGRVGSEQRAGRTRPPRRRSARTSARRARDRPSVRNTQLPSLRRSSTPASARIFKWRDTRGWLCPSTCAKLADRQLHDPQQGEDAQPRRVGERLEIDRRAEELQSRDKDIKISLYGQFVESKIIPCA